MKRRFRTVVLGGGCLGVAAAVSIARRQGPKSAVCLIEKEVVGAGLSSRHSGIVRSANASRNAARMARRSTEMWQNLKAYWGVDIPYRRPGALWIAAADPRRPPENWISLQRDMAAENIPFRSLSRAQGVALTKDSVCLDRDEIMFHEPDALLLEAPQVLDGMRRALLQHDIEVLEHTRAAGFERNPGGRIATVKTDHHDFECEFVVNALGGWSRDVFAGLGLEIPVSLEPVVVANWLVSTTDLPEDLPIIADFINRAYFRRIGNSVLHMHQPRSRRPDAISKTFVQTSNADVIYDRANYAVPRDRLEAYLEMVRNRFPRVGEPVYAGGSVSYFDITPDLEFILGPDSRIENLVHCLGAGQALKYAPLLGELMADLVIEGRSTEPGLDISEFSIARFQSKALADFWESLSGSHNGL